MKTGVILCLVATLVYASGVSVSDYLSSNDATRLKNLFISAAPYSDAQFAYWALRGLGVLRKISELPSTEAVCETLKKASLDTADNLFFVTEASKLIKCNINFNAKDYQTLLNEAATSKKVAQIYYGVTALANLKLALPGDSAVKALDEALKKDDSATSYSYAFLLSATQKMDVNKKFTLIEDIVAQADLVADRYLQFEGGLYTTALVVESSFKLAIAANKPPTIKPDQVLQLTNYLVSRKHVHRPRSAAQLLIALETLSDNTYYVPVSISLESGSAVSDTNSRMLVRVCNVLGEPLGSVSVTADSGKHIADSAVVLSKKQLTATQDKSIFELDFSSVKGPYGSYLVTFSVSPPKDVKKLIGLKGDLQLQSVTSVVLEEVEVGVADADRSTGAQMRKAVSGQKLSELVEADSHQTIKMKFSVKSAATKDPLQVHQAFVRFAHKESGQEIIYVASQDEKTKLYEFEMNVRQKEAEFGSLSGLYEMFLLVGDSIVENPVNWHVADVKLSFVNSPSAQINDSQYKPKPAIEHMFREPEKRPPAFVSNLFTGLVLVPFVIMLLIWIKMGVNISNMPVGISTFGFHVSLAAIFGLYYCYWTQLNMFETIKYLAVLAVPTFLFGNRLLNTIAEKRKGSK